MMKGKLEEKPEERKRERIDDQFDVIGKNIEVHDKGMRKNITEDFILFQAEAEERDTIKELFLIAKGFKDYVQDKPQGEELFNTILDEVKMHVLLRRNTKDNFIVGKLIKWGKDDETEGISARDVPRELLKDKSKD